ncbi:MAG TPA: aldo/keto reductase [Phycisphaerae bacterium]|nr:aldo/keto reductase [Phycisphaerae bacterium]
MNRIHHHTPTPKTADARAGRRGMNRRQFLKTAAAAGTGLIVTATAGRSFGAPSGELPKRVLGRTGAKVTILGLGTAPIGEGPPEVQEAARIFGEVLDRGVNYVDTARIYGNAEEALGLVIPKRRDNLFLVTKVSTHTAEGAAKSLEQSLRLLKTDHLDLVHIHSIGGKKLDRVLADDGVLPYLLKQKEAGKTRFIGISGHNRPANFVRMIKTGHIDVVMCVMNYADRNIYGFEETVLPECRKRNVGAVAMKAYVGIKGGFPNHKKGYVGCATTPDLLPQAMAYALDLDGVALAAVGPYTLEQAIQNVEFARKYTPLTAEQRTALLARGKAMAPTLGPRYGPVV